MTDAERQTEIDRRIQAHMARRFGQALGVDLGTAAEILSGLATRYGPGAGWSLAVRMCEIAEATPLPTAGEGSGTDKAGQ